MRVFLISILLLLTNISCSQKIEKQKELEKIIYQVIDCYNKKDYKKINKFINKEIGLFIIQSVGINPSIIKINPYYKSQDSIYISNLLIPDLYKNSLSENFKIKYESYPTFEEGCEIPSKTGLFVNPKENDILVLKEAIDYYKWEENNYGFEKNKKWDEYLTTVNKIAPNTLKIIYAGNYKDNPDSEYKKIFIFYLTFISNKWYLTILDYYTIDCSV